AAVGHVDVEQDDVGRQLADGVDGLGHRRRVADDVDEAVELRAHAGAKQLVVVDEDDADAGSHGALGSSTSSTSVPPPGEAWIVARPPWRSIRPTIDSRTPRRSAGTADGSTPGPRSRTKTCSR